MAQKQMKTVRKIKKANKKHHDSAYYAAKREKPRDGLPRTQAKRTNWRVKLDRGALRGLSDSPDGCAIKTTVTKVHTDEADSRRGMTYKVCARALRSKEACVLDVSLFRAYARAVKKAASHL